MTFEPMDSMGFVFRIYWNIVQLKEDISFIVTLPSYVRLLSYVRVGKEN
jgi:hypothetical protein